MKKDEINYALSKQIPSIHAYQSVTVQTNYGDLKFEGEDAIRIAKVLTQIMDSDANRNPHPHRQ